MPSFDPKTLMVSCAVSGEQARPFATLDLRTDRPVKPMEGDRTVKIRNRLGYAGFLVSVLGFCGVIVVGPFGEAVTAGEPASHAADKTSDKTVLNVFLLAGQSNMAGADSIVPEPPGFQQTAADRATRLTTAPLPEGEKSDRYVPWGEIQGHRVKDKLVHGPEVGFARALYAAEWRDVAIIKVYANFGCDVEAWPWGERGELFEAWTKFVDARLAELRAQGYSPRIRGFIWHQGIDDAIHRKLAGSYEHNLGDLIAVLRKRYADERTPFVLARSVNSRIAQPEPDPGNDSPMAVVRRAQVKVGESVPFAAWIDIDDLPNVNTHHFSTASQLVIGERFGESCLQLQRKRPE